MSFAKTSLAAGALSLALLIPSASFAQTSASQGGIQAQIAALLAEIQQLQTHLTASVVQSTSSPATSTLPVIQPIPPGLLPTQLTETDQVVGTGDMATTGESVTINYVSALSTGQVIDSSANHNQPLTFTLGAGQVISGLDKGVAGMKVGGTRLIVIPSSLAYGIVQYGSIPASSTLQYEVQLVSVSAGAKLPVPKISAISPSSGSTGTLMIIDGSNLGSATEIDFYHANGQLAATVPWTASNIFISPNIAAVTISGGFVGIAGPDTYQVKVVAPGGTSNAGTFTLQAPSPTPSAAFTPGALSVTSHVPFTVSGTATNVASVKVEISERFWDAYSSGILPVTNGAWSTGQTTGLSQGTYTIKVTGYADAAGTQPVNGAAQGGNLLLINTFTVTSATCGTSNTAACPTIATTTLTAAPSSGTAPLAVTFTTGSIPNGGTAGPTNAGTPSIAFGDGTTGSLTSAACTTSIPGSCTYKATHTYAAAGTYTATLSASTIQKTTAVVTVAAAPKVNLSLVATPTAGVAPLAVSFTGTAGISYTLNFGDGASATGSSCTNGGACVNLPVKAAHTYTSAGTYNAVLSSGGLTYPLTILVTAPAPALSLTASPSAGATPLIVTFTTGSLANGTSPAKISFGDGTTASLMAGACTNSIPGSCTFTATHTYTTAGNYTATLTNGSQTTTAKVAVTADAACNSSRDMTCPVPAKETATIDQNSLTSSGSVTLTGTAANVKNAYTDDLVANIQPITGTGSVSGGYITVSNGRWSWPGGSAPFTFSSGTYSVKISDPGTNAVLASGTLVVSVATKTTPVTPPATPSPTKPSPAAINSFTATPAQVAYGQTAKLSWSATNGNCNILNESTHQLWNVANTGTGTTTAITAPTTFEMTCNPLSGTGTNAVAYASVAPLPPTVASFTATPTTVPSGKAAALSWSAANGKCSIMNETTAQSWSVADVGTGTTGPLTKTTSFELTCAPMTGSGTNAFSALHVTVSSTTAIVPLQSASPATTTAKQAAAALQAAMAALQAIEAEFQQLSGH